ncbi:beta-ketoacyl synthase N-terminal-like domain-containing protein [Bacillus velezensis]|nr:beta-ketoacyl synthase N-terminal-like domain-containing protein [Bacillus velezensis]
MAHIYNFTGPNLVVDTACSSSLTAIHLAVQAIQNGEAEAAFAGGVDILLDENLFSQ